MKNLNQIIKEIDRLKPVSHVANKVVEIAGNPNSSMVQVVDVIKYDQGTTANLLRVCNSSYFGLKKRVDSIKQAVTLMGLDMVANLAVMENSSENFGEAQSGYDLEEGELWRYSVASALIAQDLAEKKQSENISLLFTCALLKDVGKVVLSMHVKDSFKEIMELVENEGFSFIEAEREIIGIDHAELGGIVAEKWNFPAHMADIIRNHHSPEKAPSDDPSLLIIYLADCICMMIGMGVGADGLAYKYYPEAVERLNFSAIDLQKTIAGFWEKIKGVEELVNLSRGEG